MRIIAGEARGRQIDAPRGRHTRPTLDRVRENIFNMLQQEVPGSNVLDLFAGSGALSLEALSRGAAFAVLVDSDREACAVQKKNIESLGYTGRTKQYHCDWQRALNDLQREGTRFDLVFLDPPYAMSDLQDVFRALLPVCGPDSLIVLEHQAGKEIAVPNMYTVARQRSWGFCAVMFCRVQTEGE